MKGTVALWWLLRRRSRDTRDAHTLTTVLAVIAFAVATAAVLVVLGGVGAFTARAKAPGAVDADDIYPVLAWIAAGLLMVPMVTLGGAAARLAVARRDQRLAALRLAGGTTGQVVTIAAGDAVAQAALGAVAGVLGYLALVPAVARLPFQGRTFQPAELWVGLPVLTATVAGVAVVALVSALVGLRRVAITPLGVAARVSPRGLRWTRLLVLAAAVGALVVTMRTDYASAAVLAVLIIAGMATLNVVGPFVIGLIGRMTVAAAKDVATLLAGRRIVDSPKTAWRSVGSVALATFIGGLASALALVQGPATAEAADAMLAADLQTGGLLTLGIAGVLAAVSTGVMQAGRVIDQRGEYRALVLAGTDLVTLDRARWRETLLPLVVSVGVATVTVLLFMVPILGATAMANVDVLVRFLLAVAAACVLVLAGAWASRYVARSVVATVGDAAA